MLVMLSNSKQLSVRSLRSKQGLLRHYLQLFRTGRIRESLDNVDIIVIIKQTLTY